jgi:hypothetical protein
MRTQLLVDVMMVALAKEVQIEVGEECHGIVTGDY